MRSAIIDIGSNALRAVVYESDELGRTKFLIINLEIILQIYLI